MTLTKLAEIIHEITGATGDELTQTTCAYAACLAFAFGRDAAGEHFKARAAEYGPLYQPRGREVDRPSLGAVPSSGWNFGGGTSGVVE